MFLEHPQPAQARKVQNHVIREPFLVRWILVFLALSFLALFLFVPLIAVFANAFAKGFELYMRAIIEPDALSAIKLTLITTVIVVPLNLVFGVAAAWAIARFDFVGKNILTTLIDIPFTVSPVIAGLVIVLFLGANSVVGGWFVEHGMKIIFAVPGIVIATLFVTFPFVARELIPLMQAQGSEEEEAAITLGANGWQTFFRITLPNIKWGLLYGGVLTAARAMGEFGAVSVVSGHIRGLTNTMPLYVEILYNEYNFQAAFTIASLLTLVGLVTLAIKSYVEWKTHQMLLQGAMCHREEKSV